MKKKLFILASLLIAVGIIGLAFNKFDLNDNLLISFEKSWSANSNEFDELIINGNTTNVRVEFIESETESDTAKVNISGKVEPLVAERIDNTVMSNQALILDLHTASKVRLVQLNFTEPEIVIQVSLPKSYALDKLQVSITSGNTKVSNAAVNLLALESRSGDISLNNMQANEAVIISQSGYLKLNSIASKLTATTGSGDIKVTNLVGELTADSRSGYITVVQKEASNATITTSSGDVKFTAADSFNGFYDVRSNSGDIKVPENNGSTDDIIKIKTGSGNINVKN